MKTYPLILAIALLVTAGRPAAIAAQDTRTDAQLQAHNAARPTNGGRVSLRLEGKDAGKDRRSMAGECFDGSVHSRCVTWGAPVVYRIELIDALPVTEINFICSDYASAASPKDLVVTLSDGTTYKKALEVIRPKNRRDKPRQRIDVGGKTIAWVEVRINSMHPGKPHPKTGKPLTYGGLGEIEVITSADLKRYLEVTSFNPDAPSYIEGASPRADYSAVKVAMPTRIPEGESPSIFMTAREIDQLYEAARKDPRSQAMLEKLFTACNGWLEKEIVHPDPAVPAQMKSRFDAQAKAHDMMAKMAGWLGWAYQFKNDAAYARKAREILMGYARLYPNEYKEHKGVHGSDTSKVMAQRLSEAMWILPLIQGYDMVKQAKCMSDADRELIEEDLIRHAIRFIHRKRSAADTVAANDRADPNWRTEAPTNPKKTVGNWVNFYNASYVQGGIVIEDQDWIDIGMAATRHNLHTGIGEDGMWGEGAIGYHLFGRRAFIACIEPLARQGIDLYSFENCIYKNLFDSPLKYAYPDGTAPGINDSGRSSIGGSWTAMDYDFAYLRYGDANYAKLINDAPRQVFQSASVYFPTVIYKAQKEAPLKGLQSLIFDSLGYAILRGEDGGGQTYLLMDYGPHGGGHGHPDKLNLILFADGDELAGEPQGYAYEDSRHKDWTRPSIAHWTLSVDEYAQMATTGKLLAFKDAGAVKVVRGTSGDAFPGVVIDRTVVQMPGYIVDVYRAWGPASHTYDYPLCFRGRLDALDDVDLDTLKPMGLDTQPGYKHILATTPAPVDGNWTGRWTRATVAEPGEDAAEDTSQGNRPRPANDVQVTVVGAPGSTVYKGTVPGGRHQAVIRREGREAVFATVIDPFKASDAVKQVEQLDVEGPVPAYALRVKRNDGGTDIVIVRWDEQTGGKTAAPTTAAGHVTDGLVSVVRLDPKGEPIDLGLVGGTQLQAWTGGGTKRIGGDTAAIYWKTR